MNLEVKIDGAVFGALRPDWEATLDWKKPEPVEVAGYPMEFGSRKMVDGFWHDRRAADFGRGSGMFSYVRDPFELCDRDTHDVRKGLPHCDSCLRGLVMAEINRRGAR